MKLLSLILLSLTAAVLADRPTVGVEGLIGRPGGERATSELNYLQATSTLDFKSGRTHRMLILQAMLHIPDSVDAVGMTHQVEITELTDETGRDLLAPSQRSGQILFTSPRYYGSLAYNRGEGRGGPIAVSNSINGLVEVPPVFKTIKGKSFLLVATRRVVSEVTPIRVGSLMELVPSLAVQVTQLKHEGGNIEMHFKYDATHEGPFFNPNVEPPFVDAITMVDDLGQLIRGRGGAPQRQEPQGNVFQGEGRVVFTLDDGRTPAALRFHIVTEVEEEEVEFEAYDVRLPVE